MLRELVKTAILNDPFAESAPHVLVEADDHAPQLSNCHWISFLKNCGRGALVLKDPCLMVLHVLLHMLIPHLAIGFAGCEWCTRHVREHPTQSGAFTLEAGEEKRLWIRLTLHSTLQRQSQFSVCKTRTHVPSYLASCISASLKGTPVLELDACGKIRAPRQHEWLMCIYQRIITVETSKSGARCGERCSWDASQSDRYSLYCAYGVMP